MGIQQTETEDFGEFKSMSSCTIDEPIAYMQVLWAADPVVNRCCMMRL